jgi:PH (Pleckstrin Homology) domain-containing protein
VAADKHPDTGRDVYRSSGAVVLWWIWLVLAVAGLADLAVQGRDHASLVAAALTVAITGFFYACAQRPRVVADADGITVLNPLRDYQVPWGAVDQVDIHGALRVHCLVPEGAAKGRAVLSWAVQASPRAVLRGQTKAQRAAQRGTAQAGYGRYPSQVQDVLARTPGEQAAYLLDERAQRERSAGAAGGLVRVQWAWLAIAAMAVPSALLLAVVLI